MLNKNLLLLLLLFVSSVSLAQLNQIKIYSETDNSENEFSKENRYNYDYTTANNNALNFKGVQNLVVDFQNKEKINTTFSSVSNLNTKKITGVASNFNIELELVNNHIKSGKFTLNGEDFTIEAEERNTGDKLYYTKKVDESVAGRVSTAKYSDLASFTDFSQADILLDTWGEEINQMLEVRSPGFDNSAPVFYGCYDWHSSVHGQYAAVYSSKVLNNSTYNTSIYNRYTNSAVTGERSYRTDIDETLYGVPYLLLYAVYLKEVEPTKYETLKPLITDRYNQVKQDVTTIGGTYYRNSVDSGYGNYNFAMLGTYKYAKMIGDTATTEYIENFIKNNTATLDWSRISAEDFFYPEAIALLLYNEIGMTSGTSWDNLINNWKSTSLTTPSFSGLSSHRKGTELTKSWGILQMYNLTKEQKYLDAYVAYTNALYQDLKSNRTRSTYFANDGHWLPNLASLGIKFYRDASDTTAPTAPSNLVANNTTQTSTQLSWSASTDDTGVTGYDVYRGASKLATVTSTTYTVNGLTENTNYTFTVKAKDAAGNISATSNTVSVTTLKAPDTSAPTVPTNVTASNTTETSTTISWSASTDDTGVTGYDIYRNGSKVTTVAGTTYTASNLTDNTTYTFGVKAKDAAGNASSLATVTVTTLEEVVVVVDTEAPTNPQYLSLKNITDNSLTLKWSVATDNVGVAEYVIYNGDVELATSTSNSYDTSLVAGTTYSFRVSAKDAAGNESETTNTIVWVVPGEASTGVDTEAPTNPQYLSLKNITDSSLTLKWRAATDNVKVAEYVIYNGTTQLATSETNAYNLPLQADTTYAFNVKAKDAAGNISNGATNTVIWVTAAAEPTSTGTDTEAPTTPKFLSVTNIQSSSAFVIWRKATDNVGVKEYILYNGDTEIARIKDTATTLALTPNTDYNLKVTAVDYDGNESSYNNIVPFTTPQ